MDGREVDGRGGSGRGLGKWFAGRSREYLLFCIASPRSLDKCRLVEIGG
jgi:hypothetical protein